MFQSAMEDLVMRDWVQPTDVADFADSFVFDEQTQICFAYDPHDNLKRRLNTFNTQADCQPLNCFDCAFTAGKCVWDPNTSLCRLPPPDFDAKGLR